MKKFTFLLSLLLASAGVTASAQDTFVASSAPSDGNWAANTHWYIMKLDNKFVTTENVDENQQIKLTADNTLTNTNITSGADQWCIVGDATTGYKFYNKKAGVNVVFGMTNDVSNTGGAARSKMYTSTTTHSTETTGTGILFDIKTKNNVKNVYYVSLKDATDNRYWNQRDSYVSYWTDGDAYGNSGSQVRFYNSDTYWDSYWNLTDYQSWADNAPVGTDPFTYPQTAVNTFKSAIATVQNEVNGTSISHATATAAAATLKTAKNTFRKAIYGPADNYVCKIKNPNLGRFIHASTTWTAGSTFPLNNSDNDRSVVFVIEKNEDGTYNIKSRDTGMYIKEANPYTSTATKEDATDFVIYGSQECDSKVVIGTGDNFSNFSKWFHANNTNLITWEAEAPNSYWEFTPISDDEFAALADTRTSNLALMPGVDTNEASIKAALDTYNGTHTAESWNSVVTAVNNVLNSKFYRINNNRPDKNGTKGIKLLASDGGNKPKMYTIAEGNKLVSSLWKFKLNNEGGFSLSNVNNPEKYVATLTQAGSEAGETAKDFTDEANAVQFTLSQQSSGWLTITDQYGNILNGENAGNCPINYWNSGRGSEGAIWQINEVKTFDVDLNTVGEKSYATAYLPFGVSEVSGAEAYVGTLSADNTVLNMTQTTSVPAEKGFVLVGAADAKATLTIGNANELNTALTGTLVKKAIADEQANYLVFGKNNADNTKVGFFKPTAATIPANKAFLDATALTSGAGAIAMNFGGNTTGVNTVVLGENGVNAPVFDLCGRRVVAPVKGGVYIQNGKKFIK